MRWHDETELALAEIKASAAPWQPHDVFALIDATYLQYDYTADEWQTFVNNGVWQQHHVAAFCVQRQFLPILKTINPDPTILIATVANFPEGESSLNDVQRELDEAIQAGCDEIDVVFPYFDFLAGNEARAFNCIQMVRQHIPHHTLKVIVESGAFTDHDQLYRASRTLLDLGIDFLKTSTGMIKQGADPIACYTFLKAIRDHGQNKGIKLSGGVRTIEQVIIYLNLIEQMCGREWIQPQHVRIGASQLIQHLKSSVSAI